MRRVMWRTKMSHRDETQQKALGSDPLKPDALVEIELTDRTMTFGGFSYVENPLMPTSPILVRTIA